MDADEKQNGIVNISFQNTESAISLDAIKKDENKFAVREDSSEKHLKRERRLFYVSLSLGWICISLTSSVLLTLLNSVTSLLAEDNLGNISVGIGSGFHFITTSLLLAFVTKIIGVKRTLIISTCVTLLYTAAFFYPVLPVFIPASVLMGIGLSVILSNASLFGNSLGYWYHRLFGGSIDNILFLMSGLISAAIGSGLLWGNIIYYQVLDTKYENYSIDANFTLICGASYCNEDLGNSTIAAPPPKWRVNTLMGIFIGMLILALGLYSFVVEPNTRLNSTPGKIRDFFRVLKELFILLKDTKSLLLVIVTIFIGMEEQFIMVVFTHAYVTCSLGITKIGYIMLCFGITQTITPFIQWPLMKYCGRPVVTAIYYFVFIGLMVGLLLYKPSGDDAVVYYVVAGVHGMADTMAIAAVFSTYAVLFEKNIECGLCLAGVWFAIGSFVGNTLNPILCTYLLLYLLILLATLGVFLLLVLEYIIYKNKNKQ